MAPRNDPSRLLTIYANPICPHCVQATDMVTQWCTEAGVPVAGADITTQPELLSRLGVEHSPALVLRTGQEERVLPTVPSHDVFARWVTAR